MAPKTGRTRRRLLACSSAAIAATSVLAGCSALLGDGESRTTAGGDGTGAAGTKDTAATRSATTGGTESTADERDGAETTRTTVDSTDGDDDPTAYVLEAAVPGWKGTDPSRIDGETNPTLRMTPGETYEIRWLNLDGQRHQFVLADAEGTVLETSEPSEEQGATRVLQVEATAEMATYRCKFHPQSMQGSVAAGDSSPTGGNGTAGGTTEAR